MARGKAAALARTLPAGLVIGADTVVVLEGRVLRKPSGPADAAAMLASLGGRRHEVVTGVAVVDAAGGHVRWGHAVTRLRLRPLSGAEIARYVATGEPLDKAGAYALQGAAADWVLEMEGDRDTVVGLPIALLRRLLPEGLLGSAGDQPADGER